MADAAVRPRADAYATLKDIIATRCMKRGQFKLASGATSTWYFDMKPALMDPEGSHLVARLMLDALAREPMDSIGGLAMGKHLMPGTPLAGERTPDQVRQIAATLK